MTIRNRRKGAGSRKQELLFKSGKMKQFRTKILSGSYSLK